MEHGCERGLVFDYKAAEHRLSFNRFCRHSKGEWEGLIFHPEPWQAFIDINIFGWKREDGNRRFKMVYESEARKNGKSTRLATTGLYLAFFDGEGGAEVYTAASKYDQAVIVHSESVNMVRASPELRDRITIFKNSLTLPKRTQKYIPLGRDSKTLDGLNVHGALIDELHAHPTSELYDVLKTGMGSRRQPMLYAITTAGFDKSYPCFEMEQRIKRILAKEEDDDTVFGIVYTMDDEDEKENSDLWIKANPNLGISVKPNVLADNLREAQSIPARLNNFYTKHLNVWTDAETRWISPDAWHGNAQRFDEAGLAGNICWAALDLSTTTDLAAWVLCFPPDVNVNRYRFLFRFFLPEDDLQGRIKREKVDYRAWVKQGYITLTNGNVVDYEYVTAQILKDAGIYKIQEIAYDPWNSTSVVNKLQEELGDICIEFRQGFASMSPACKDFERKVLGGMLATNDNPVMRWMIGCTEIATDPAGNIKLVKPDRKKTGKHIDGVVASVMALNRAVMATEKRSVYEERGLIML